MVFDPCVGAAKPQNLLEPRRDELGIPSKDLLAEASGLAQEIEPIDLRRR
ncbi:MAG: hypothetical protein ABI398_11610 [Devosia sp.]